MNIHDNAQARKQPKITMYCTPWCPDCRTCKRYMDERRLQYTEIDISKDKAAERKARELAGASTPLEVHIIGVRGEIRVEADVPGH